MAFSLSSATTSTTILVPCSKLHGIRVSPFNCFNSRIQSQSVVVIKCESSEPWAKTGLPEKQSKLEIGSPVIIIEAPKTLKTAASVPCLSVNSGIVNPGDVGRIMSRKPKDVWAIRLTIGTYLIDGKYFKPLELDENE